MKNIVFVLATICLAGCAQLAAQRASEDVNKATLDCRQKVLTSDDVAVLRGKIILLDTERPTIEMLSDQRKASKEEQEAVVELDKILIDCAVRFDEVFRRNYSSEYVAIFREASITGQ